MVVKETAIPGCFILRAAIYPDGRGHFIKWFNKESFDAENLCSDWAEVYASLSNQGVIRGLHFQRPPADHVKLVYCLSGSAIDVVLDLRRGSPTFGKHIKIHLTAQEPIAVYIPSGCAHGFYAELDNTLLMYQVSSVHVASLDSGIRWNSVGIEWPTHSPIISPRDMELEEFSCFDSPFKWL